MSAKLIFSHKYTIDTSLRLIRLLTSNQQSLLLSLKTTLRIKLINKRFLFRIYKKLLKFHTINKVLHSNFIVLYCLLKRYIINYLPWILTSFVSFRNLAFFLYHFLVLYKAVFLLKMILDWFPVKNWDRASPVKRFLRRATIDWTKQFEKYFPPIAAWLIVINIIPIFLSLIETTFIARDFSHFPMGYKFDDLVEFVLDSNLHTINCKNYLK